MSELEHVGVAAQQLQEKIDNWLSMHSAPRDGTVIEIRCHHGAPWYGLFKWSGSYWVSVHQPENSILSEDFILWRSYGGNADSYIDPTDSAQNALGYWKPELVRRGEWQIERRIQQGMINDMVNVGQGNPPLRCDFSTALFALKTGKRVRRSGWNGKGMYIIYQPGYPEGVTINWNTQQATGLPEGTKCRFSPYLSMKSVDNSFFPWTPNMLDILADDWELAD